MKKIIMILIISIVFLSVFSVNVIAIDNAEVFYEVKITKRASTIKKAVKAATGFINDELMDNMAYHLKSMHNLFLRKKVYPGEVFPTTFYIPRNYVEKYQKFVIQINVPSCKVRLYQKYKGEKILIKQYWCAVGAPAYPTPIGPRLATKITWNPWWYPPKHRAWAKNAKVTPPGPRNPLGKANIDVGDAVYIHGSPARKSMGRAASHACIRMLNENAVELCAYIQKRTDNPGKNADISKYLRSWRTRRFWFKNPVQVYVTYNRVEVDDDYNISINPDFYGRKRIGVASVIKAIKAADLPMLEFDTKRIRKYLRGYRRKTFSYYDIVKSLTEAEIIAKKNQDIKEVLK